jgi:serine/threonine protein kinase/Tol biopolymer transport system component
MSLAPGSRLGSFEILELLGSGGMGEVYRARDTSLKRDVAIKVLPASYSLDPDRLRRFQLEAEAAAALNHPNILSIFHIGQHDGSPYIVAELLEGETLRERLRRGPMRLRETLDIAADITRGLAVAHEKGIIHRDLKPENLFLTKDGRVKILDFGLAKLLPTPAVSADGRTATLEEQTDRGRVLGTVGYMSPEQVRGLPADARSDIFGFGAVLYEMLTRHRAFKGETSADTLSAILHSDPPALSASSSDIPPAPARVVRRCLEKSPEQRFQSAHDLGYALEAAAAGSDSTPGIDSGKKRRDNRISVKWLATAPALCAVIGLLYLWLAPRIERELRLRQLQQLTVVPLTALPGNVASPTFSPDGSQIAFAWDGENNGAGFDLYVKAIGTEKPLRLTHNPALQLSAAWAPDGRSIAIARDAEEGKTGIYLLPPTGGAERKLTSKIVTGALGTYLAWSPDGKRLVFTDHPTNSSSDATILVYLLSLDTLERTPAKTGCNQAEAPSFSPRGDLLAWVCADTAASYSVNVLRLGDGRVTRLAQHTGGISGIAWSADGGRIVFSAPFHSGDLWEVSVTRPGNVLKLPIGHNASDLTGSLAGGRLAYVEGITNINIWRLDLLASPPQARKLVTSSREQIAPSISPDGSRIAFQSNRTGSNEVWVCDADGSNPIQITSFGLEQTGTPRWSPDGKLIAFDSRIGGEANIYLVDPQGGVPRKMEIDTHDNSLPSWSHDGNWIYFTNGSDANHTSVWKVPSTGGHATKISQSPGFYPMESPDGQYVYFYRRNTLWRVGTAGSGEQVVRGMPTLNPDFIGGEWYPFGSGIYFMSHWGDRIAINFFDLKTGHTRQIIQLEKTQLFWIGGMPVSSDGRWLFFPQLDAQSSNLMLIENWQ